VKEMPLETMTNLLHNHVTQLLHKEHSATTYLI